MFLIGSENLSAIPIKRNAPKRTLWNILFRGFVLSGYLWKGWE